MFIKHRIKVFSLILLPFLLSCDFRIPQAWETPTWIFDLTIPLINEEYSMSEIADGNDITFNVDTTHFLIEMIDTIIDSGDVETDSSFFIIDGSILPLALNSIMISNNDIDFDIPGINEEITIADFSQDFNNPTCLPKIVLEDGYEYEEIIPIESMCGSIDVECIESVNWIKIQDGENTLTVDNSFPFDIASISIEINEYTDEDGDGEYTEDEEIGESLFTTELEDIGQISTSVVEVLDDIELTCEILGQIYLSVDPVDVNDGDCNVYQIACEDPSISGDWDIDELECSIPINEQLCEDENIGGSWDNDECTFPIVLNEEFCLELGFSWQEGQCIQILDDIDDPIACEAVEGQWDENQNQCFIIIILDEDFCLGLDATWNDENNSCYFPLDEILCEDENIGGVWDEDTDLCHFICTDNEQCCEGIRESMGIQEGSWWVDGNCELPFGNGEGWDLEGDEKIVISNELSIESFKSINVDIADCSFDSSQEFPLAVDEGIQLIEGHISILEDIDINRIAFDLTNKYFSPLEFTIQSDNLVDLNGDSLNRVDTIDVEAAFEDIILTDYSILNPHGGVIDNMLIDISTNINDSSGVIINFDHPYKLEGSGVELTTIELDRLSVILSEFTTPPIDMGSVPSGFEGFDLPYLTFKLYLKNQIAADMKLVLDISGISDDDEILIHVEPEISFPADILDIEEGTDTLTIAFVQDNMIVSSIYHDPQELIYPLEHKITDLFSYDEINVSGYALMDGDAELIPGRGLWGELEIRVSPLTIIFENQISFVPQEFTEISIMDSEIATKIDSGLISGELGMNIENNIPFGGNLLMYISNAEEFPLCIDSLITGTLEAQSDLISTDCMSIIGDNGGLGCNEFSVSYYDYDSTLTTDNLTFVKRLDCITNNDVYYFKSLLNLEFLNPTLSGEIFTDDNGNGIYDEGEELEDTNNNGVWDNLGIVDSPSIYDTTFFLDEELHWFTEQQTQYLIPRFVFNNELVNSELTYQPSNYMSINSILMLKILNTGLLEE